MITTSQMYWLTRLDNIVAVLCLFGIACVIIACAIGFATFVEHDIDGTYNAGWMRTCRRLLCAAALMWIVGTFIPTTKEMAAIIVIPKIVNNEKVQDAGNKLYNLAVEWLDALNPEKNAKEGK